MLWIYKKVFIRILIFHQSENGSYAGLTGGGKLSESGYWLKFDVSPGNFIVGL